MPWNFQIQYSYLLIIYWYYKKNTVVPPLIRPLPYKGHLYYQARFQMHWDSKILLNCPLQERASFFLTTSLLSGQISDPLRYQNTTKLSPSRESILFLNNIPLIRPDFRRIEIPKYYKLSLVLDHFFHCRGSEWP